VQVREHYISSPNTNRLGTATVWWTTRSTHLCDLENHVLTTRHRLSTHILCWQHVMTTFQVPADTSSWPHSVLTVEESSSNATDEPTATAQCTDRLCQRLHSVKDLRMTTQSWSDCQVAEVTNKIKCIYCLNFNCCYSQISITCIMRINKCTLIMLTQLKLCCCTEVQMRRINW